MTSAQGIGLIIVLSAGAAPVIGQGSAVIKSTVQEVLVDLVVRDKHQRMVRDLQVSQVQILEDGVSQEIRSFEFVSSKGSRLLSGKLLDRFEPLHELNVIALVFGPMSNDARQNAGSMAHEFLRNPFLPNTLLGAFALNRRLDLLQPFTNRLELLDRAVEVATRNNYVLLHSLSEENRAALNLSRIESGAKGTTSSSALQWQPLRLGDASERGPELDPVIRNLKSSIEKMESTIMRYAESMRSTESLLALIRVMAAIPGRKTVLLFSIGLPANEDLSSLLARVISEANRANVSFYTVNANGLKLSTGQTEADFDAARLGELAERTGGFSMENSNDLRGPLRRVVEDSGAHYELTYKPRSDSFDGHFRRIEIRVDRPEVTVQTRDGYFALPMIAGQMLQPFEIQCLKALNESPRPHTFQFDVAAVRFNDVGGEAQYQVVVEIPSSVPRLAMESDGKLLSGGISILAVLKDPAGHVVDKTSQPLGLRIESTQLAQFQRSPLTATLPLSVPPGRFTLEVALVDSSRRASTAELQLNITPSAPPEISDIVVVGLLQSSKTTDESPFNFAGQRVIPSLQRRFSLAKLKSLPIFFTIHRTVNSPISDVRLELCQADHVLATATPAAESGSTPDEMPFLASIPIDKLPKGIYDLVVKAKSGAGRDEKRVRIQLE